MDLSSLISELMTLKQNAKVAIAEAEDCAALEATRVELLGKKGALTSVLRMMAQLSPDDRPKLGKCANEVKEEIQTLIEKRERELVEKEISQKLRKERLDVTLPGRAYLRGRLHPITQTFNDIVEILRFIGFEVVTGPEAEWDYYNFEALNIPPDHPARDMQATFFLSDDVVLRTHTSPVQIRGMLRYGSLPVRLISPGKVYRRDSADASHAPMFTQVEGLYVDKQVSMAQLKSDLTYLLQEIFDKKDITVRFRPSFFPFTEPSVEVDIGCLLCGGKGCSACKNTGYMEVLGAGMVDPHVWRYVGFESLNPTGYAFGGGIERIAMLRYGINDIRLFFENDYRFLDQF